MNRKAKLALSSVLGALLVFAVGWNTPAIYNIVSRAVVGSTSNPTAIEDLFVVRAGGSNPTCATSTALGELCVEGDIETNGAIDAAGAVATGALTVTGAATISSTLGVTGALTQTGAATFNGAVTTNSTLTANGHSPASPAWTLTPTTGANKDFFGIQADGTTYSASANELNHLYIDDVTLNTTLVAVTGAYLMTMDATGLDIGGGTITENDNMEIWGNALGATGRPMIVGTDAAFQFCVTVTFTDVSGSDAFYCGWREAATVPSAIGSYTDWFAVGHVSGDFYEIDEDGSTDVDYTDWADTESKAMCILVSAAGVASSTVAGAGPGTPNAQTLTDGLMVVPFCNLLHDAHLAEDTIITYAAVDYQ